MRYFAEIDRDTGFILRCGSLPLAIADKVFEQDPTLIEVDVLPDPSTQKVDLRNGRVIRKSAADCLPLRDVMDHEIQRELAATDFTQVLDSPFTDAEQVLWRAYRQALRDLSKLSSVSQMVASWPKRPDGREPFFR